MEKSTKDSTFNLLFGLLMLGCSLWALYDGFHCEPTECNSSPTFWSCASVVIVFLPLAVFFLSRPLWNIRWDGENIHYRTWYGIRVKAPLSSIDDIEFNYFSNDAIVKFINRKELYIESSWSNVEELLGTLQTHLGRKYPHKVYQAAFRGIVEESENCGCLICYSIYPKHKIVNWQPYLSDDDDDELDYEDLEELDIGDLGICPICNLSQGVIADFSKSIISLDEMRLLNEKIESMLDKEERSKRQNLRIKVSKDPH